MENQGITDNKEAFFSNIVKDRALHILKNYVVTLVLLLIIIVVSIITPQFFSLQNMENVLKQISVIGILSCGMTFVIITGLVDLSVGSIISLIGVLYVRAYLGAGIGVAILVCLAAGALCGLVSGGIISGIKGKLGESFIVTYGMQSILAAAALLASGGVFQQGPADNAFAFLGNRMLPIIILLLAIILGQFFLTKTRQGRIFYFLGSNAESTRLSGIRIKSYYIFAFVLSGFFAAIAAMVMTSRVGAASPTAGLNYELDAIAAVVVGGVSLTGGIGSMLNTTIGIIVMGVLANALTMLGITTYPQMIIKGAIIAFAVVIDVISKRNN